MPVISPVEAHDTCRVNPDQREQTLSRQRAAVNVACSRTPMTVLICSAATP